MRKLLFITSTVFLLSSCKPSIEMNRAGAAIADLECRKAIQSVEPAFATDDLIMVGLVDTRVADWDSPQEQKVFAFPKDSFGKTKYLCKVDLRTSEIAKLTRGNKNIIQHIDEELRTF